MKKENFSKETVWFIKFVTSTFYETKIYEIQVGDTNTIIENNNNVLISLTKIRFENLINSLLEKDILRWNDKYEQESQTTDETWKLTIELYDGKILEKKGKNKYPDNFNEVLSILKKYGIVINKKNKNEKIKIYSEEINSLFNKDMITRGINFFNKGAISSIKKINNTYYSTLNNIDNYHIRIELNAENEIVNMKCDCPYEGNCKHEYAVILKIKEKNYKNKITVSEKDDEEVKFDISEKDIDTVINAVKNINKVKWKKLKLSEDYKKELLENGFDLDSIKIPSRPDYPNEIINFFVLLSKINFYDENYLFNVQHMQDCRINDLDLKGIRTFLTYMYKQEDSQEGLIARYIENGKLVQLLIRLKEVL